MPIEITKSAPAQTSVSESDVDALLVKDGALTLEGQVIQGFLESVEFDDLLADEDVSEFVEGVEAVGAEDADGITLIEGATEPKEGQEFVIVETLSGEAAAALIDADDLHEAFVYYVGCMPESTLSDKVAKAAAIALLGEDDASLPSNLDEASVFKKGAFRKIHSGAQKTSGGKTGPELVKRMMVAMLKKEAIKRASKPGTGYKGGDYEKNGAGYGSGTAKGKKAVALFKGKNTAKIKTAAKKVKGAAGAEVKLKAKAAAKAAKEKAKTALKKPVKAQGKGEKKALVASEEPSTGHRLHEGAILAGKIMAGRKPLQG